MSNRKSPATGPPHTSSARCPATDADKPGMRAKTSRPTKHLTLTDPLNNKAFLIRAPVAQADRAIAF